jgi:hypothetical protein
MRKNLAHVLWILPLAALVLVACPLPGIVKAPGDGTSIAVDPTTHLVGISGDRGPFTYTLNPVKVHRGDTIRWFAPVAWEVDIGINGPTDRRIISGAAGDSGLAVIRLTAPAKEYKYSVTLRIGNLLITDDPKMIVQEEEG